MDDYRNAVAVLKTFFSLHLLNRQERDLKSYS